MKRDIYPIELIKTGILLLNVEKTTPIKGFYPYRASRALIFYTYEKFEKGILPINREYKPIGLSHYDEYVDYDKFEFLLIPYDRINMNEQNKYFFDDGCYPYTSKAKKRYVQMIKEFFKNDESFLLLGGEESRQ